MKEYDVYSDISRRTNGEMFIGVVGPVRTGKSTFIKRFMELMVIPGIENEQDREVAIDEMPQSANGKIVMTTEPKFIPEEAVNITLEGGGQQLLGAAHRLCGLYGGWSRRKQ